MILILRLSESQKEQAAAEMRYQECEVALEKAQTLSTRRKTELIEGQEGLIVKKEQIEDLERNLATVRQNYAEERHARCKLEHQLEIQRQSGTLKRDLFSNNSDPLDKNQPSKRQEHI